MTTQEAFALALQQHQAGRLADAEALYRQILAAQPNHAAARHHLGLIAYQAGRHDLAIELIRQALVLAPDNPSAYSDLAEVWHSMGRWDEAIASYNRALELQPDYPKAWNNLGNASSALGRLDEAATAFRRALELRPDYAMAHYNLGVTLTEQGRLDEAVASLSHALELEPNDPEACNNLAHALKSQGRLDATVAAYRRALALDPDRALVQSNLIYALHFHPRQDDRAIAGEHRRWNQQFSKPLRPFIRPHGNERSSERRLKVGYVSPDFWSHPISFFFAPLLEAHDRRQYEIYCYASVRRPDAVTGRLRKSADVWRDVRALSDVQLAECVRDDGIDILVDLTMHTADNRLAAFARKPAPVQVSWLAYPGSTGMEAIDYRLTDAHIDPDGQEADGLGGEAVRLPDSWCCYAPIEEFPSVSPLPATQKGSITFGSLNQFSKINEELLCGWARLLQAVPAARLIIVCPEGQARERTHGLLAAHGIAAGRVELVAPCPWPDYIRLFERIDLALDSSPCNGMTTTCHALWMGVPVLTLSGKSAVSRAGDSLLQTMGLPDWVARSEEEYLRIAVKWAHDLPHLAELRQTLRARMQASPLMDAPRFARNIETAYRTLWQRWCAEKQS